MVKIKYYGMIAEGVGQEEQQLDLAGGTVKDLDQSLKKAYVVLHTTPYRYAVNNRLVQDDHPLNTGDEVAVLPPFAGG